MMGFTDVHAERMRVVSIAAVLIVDFCSGGTGKLTDQHGVDGGLGNGIAALYITGDLARAQSQEFTGSFHGTPGSIQKTDTQPK